MDMSALNEFLASLTVYSKNCDDCNTINKLITCCLRNFDQNIARELLLRFCEHALEHEDKISAERIVKFFFNNLPQSELQLGRALLLRAKIMCPEKFDADKFKPAMDCIIEVFNLTKNSSLSIEEFTHLQFTCCTTFWEISRKFMQRAIRMHLKPTEKILYIGHLWESSIANIKWKIFWGLSLIEACLMMDEEDEATEIWKKMEGLIHEVPVSTVRYCVFKLCELNKQDKFKLPPKLFEMDSVLHSFLEIWTYKYRYQRDSSSGSRKDSPGQHTSRTLLTEITDDTKFTSLVHSIFTPKENLFTSEIDRYEILKELFYVCVDAKILEIANKCVKSINKLELNPEPLDKDILKIILKEMNKEHTNDFILTKQHNMVAIGKAYRSLQKQMDANDSATIQAGCVLLWNLCLNFLDRSTREQIYPSFILIERGFDVIQSNYSKLICQLSMEMAKCDLVRNDYLSAERHWKKAITEDIFNTWEDLLEIRMLHYSIVNDKMKIRPLNRDEYVVYNLYELMSCKPQNASHCRAILLDTANALTDDLFSILLYAEQWPMDAGNEEKWLEVYNCSTSEITSQCEHLSPNDSRRKFLLWARITRFAIEYNVWDIGILAAKFCMATPVGMKCHIRFSSLSALSTAKPAINDFRIYALVNFNFIQSLINKLSLQHLSILNLDDNSVELQQKITSVPSNLRDSFSKIVKYTCGSIANSLKLTFEIGTYLREPWIVITSAGILWNCIYNLQKDAKLNILLPLVKLFQKYFKTHSARSEEMLSINYTGCIVRLTITEVTTQVAPITSKSLLPSMTTNVKELTEICADTILQVYSHHGLVWDFKLVISFQSLVRLWLKLNLLLDVKIDDSHFFAFHDNDKKVVNTLIYMERFRVAKNNQNLEENEEIVSLEKAISLANECECEWISANVHLSMWSLLADFAFINGLDSEFNSCYKKALELESKISDYIDENYKCLCMLMCIKAELIFKTKSNCVKEIDSFDLYIQSAKKSAVINDYKLFSSIIKLMWNVIFPLLENFDLRHVLRQPLTDIVEICLENAKHIMQSKKIVDENVCVNFLKLTCYMVNGLIQILVDNEEFDLARHYLEQAVSILKPLKFTHEIYPHLTFLLQILNTDISRVAKTSQYSSKRWKEIAFYNKIPEIQTEAAFNAVTLTEEHSDTIEDKLFNLLSFSEFLLLSESEDNNLSLANTILAHKLIFEFVEDYETTSDSISANLILICVQCQLMRYLKRGAIEFKSLVQKAGNIILNIWREIASNNPYVKDLHLTHDAAKWMDLNIHLRVPITLLWNCDNANTKNMLQSIQKCLQFLIEEMDWLHYHALMLPVIVLNKIFLYNTDEKEKIFLANLKLLKLCSDLNFTQKATDLHSAIFQPNFSAEHAMLNIDNLDQMRYINALRTDYSNRKEKEIDFSKSSVVDNDSLDVAMDEIKELLSLGYVGLAILALQKVFSYSEVIDNDLVFGRAAMLLAELELFSGNYEAAKDLILRNQKFITNEEDALTVTFLYLEILINLKHKNWKTEAQLVLKETENHFNNLSFKFPQNSQFYDELLLQLQIRGLQIFVTHCDKNFDDECSDQIQFLLQRASECTENGWIKYALQIYTTLLKTFLVNPILQKCGYDHPLCIMVTNKISDAVNDIEEILTEDVHGVVTKLLHGIQPLRKEFLDIKINLATLTAMSANTRIIDISNMQDASKYSYQNLIAEKYVHSLPPWIWEDAAEDYILNLEEIIVSMSMNSDSDNADTFSREKIQELLVTGKSLLLAAKSMASVHHFPYSDVSAFPSPPFSNMSLLPGIGSGSTKTELLHNLHLNLTTQAAQYFIRCIQEAKSAYPDLASDAALHMVDCGMVTDKSIAAQFLLWYQSFEVNEFIRNSLLETFSNPSSSILASVLHQQKYINEKNLGQSPLYEALDDIAREAYKFWEIFDLPGQNFDLHKLVPSEINVLIVLQHSKTRDLLYGAICSHDGVTIAKTECSPGYLRKLISRYNEIQEEWFNFKSQTRHFKPILSPQVNHLLRRFRHLLHDVETYLGPILNNFGVSLSSSPNTSDENLRQTTILLLADPLLQCLPLEAISFFQNHFVSCCIIRDFSIQIYISRRAAAVTSSPPKFTKGDRKINKSKPSRTDAIWSPDTVKLCCVIEDVFDAERKFHPFGESIIEFFTAEGIKTDPTSLIIGDSSYISGGNWGQSEISRSMRGLICVASPQVCCDFIKTRMMCSSSSETKISVIVRYSDKFTANEKFNFVLMALLLTLTGFSTVIVNQRTQHKFTVEQNIRGILKELATNWRGAGFGVSVLNGISKKIESSNDEKSSSSPHENKLQAKWKSDKFNTRIDNAKEFHMIYLDNSLVCYGLPNTAAF